MTAGRDEVALVLVALNFAPIHVSLLRAFEKGARSALAPKRVKVTYILSESYRTFYEASPNADVIWTPESRSGAGTILSSLKLIFSSIPIASLAPERSSRTVVFTQAVHPYNALLLRRLRRLNMNTETLYYLHEPSALITKIRKGDGLLRSIMTYLVQTADTAASDHTYVSRDDLVAQAKRAFPFISKEKLRVAPLLFDDLTEQFGIASASGRPQRDTVLYMGRANEARCLPLFFESARLAHQQGHKYRFVILTNSLVDLPRDAPSNLTAKIGMPFSNQEMVEELSRTLAVYNLYKVPYSQSAVTPVSLMFGVPLLLSGFDPSARELVAAGNVVVPQPLTPAGVLGGLAELSVEREQRHTLCRAAFETLFSYKNHSKFYGAIFEGQADGPQ